MTGARNKDEKRQPSPASHIDAVIINSDNYYSFDYQRLHPSARREDFFTNGKLLENTTIEKLEEILKNEKRDGRYSKKYLNDQFGIDLGEKRGGILRIKDKGNDRYSLYAVYKGLKLGEGGFGKVKLIQNLRTGEIYALKVLKPTPHPELKAYFASEANILSQLGRGDDRILEKIGSKHPMSIQKKYSIQKFIPGKELFMVLKNDTLNLAELFNIAIQVIQRIKELHKANILHRDIKPENFIYDRLTKKIIVVDLGLSIEKHQKTHRNPGAGTPGYQAPETLKDGTYGTASDVYALGCLLEDIFMKSWRKSAPIMPAAIHNRINLLIHRMRDEDENQRIDLDNAIENLKQIQLNFSQLKVQPADHTKNAAKDEINYVIKSYLAAYLEKGRPTRLSVGKYHEERLCKLLPPGTLKDPQYIPPYGIDNTIGNKIFRYIGIHYPEKVKNYIEKLQQSVTNYNKRSNKIDTKLDKFYKNVIFNNIKILERLGNIGHQFICAIFEKDATKHVGEKDIYQCLSDLTTMKKLGDNISRVIEDYQRQLASPEEQKKDDFEYKRPSL